MSSRSKRILALAAHVPDVFDNDNNITTDTRNSPSVSKPHDSPVIQSEAIPSTSRDSMDTSDIAHWNSSQGQMPLESSAQPQSSSLQSFSSSAKIDEPSTSSPSKTYVLSSSEESDPYADSEESYVPSELESDSISESSEEEGKFQGLENNEEQEEENYEEQEEENNEEQAKGDKRINERSKIEDTWKDCENIPSNFHFSGTSGLQNLTCDLANPYDIFRQFVTDEVLDIIMEETNRYASQYLRTHVIRRRSLLRKWKETSRSERKKFIGILLIMGMNSLPKMRLYWSGDQMFGNRVIQKTMKRDRFDCLLKEDLVIDESMVPWRGRLNF